MLKIRDPKQAIGQS